MLLRQCLRRIATASRPSITSLGNPTPLMRQWAQPAQNQLALRGWRVYRSYATTRSEADEKMDTIQDQYATAKDEFEIAAEETEKKTVYAAEDRAAAVEECTKLKELYETTVKESSPEVAAEITRRVGQRIRELDEAIKGMEAAAMEN